MSNQIDFDKWLESQTWFNEDICGDCSVEGRLNAMETASNPVSLDVVNEKTANICLTDRDFEPILKFHKMDCTSSVTAATVPSIERSTEAHNADTSSLKRLSDEELYKFAMDGQNLFLECENSCKSNCNGTDKLCCFQSCSLKEIKQIREGFWHGPDDPKTKSIPNRDTRRRRMLKLLTDAFDNRNKDFIFYVGGRQVCLVTSKSKNKPEQWIASKNQLLGIANVKETTAEDNEKSKLGHATVFIKYLADVFAETGYEDTDSVDLANRPDVILLDGFNDEKKQQVKYLPYDSSKEVFEEYKNFYADEERHMNPADRESCGITTFRKALANLSKEIKLRTARGAFETCSVCNNLNDTLKNTKMNWTKDQLEVVLKLKRLHLQQQAAERRDAALRKLTAKTSFIGNDPEYFYMEVDGYTEYKCLTPRQWQYRQNKGDTKRMGNRVIGLNVTCGHIETRFVYSLDDLVYGGANTMIEIIRQAFHDLASLLANLPNGGCKMPRRGFLQFDNCGENKNKYMYGYLSLLNFLGYFDSIQVNYLIVGHTHGPIDQYFSVITNKLWDTPFVGSPMALQCLLLECENPQINRQLWVHRDWKAWLDPILNHSLKFISIPHVVLFTRELSLSILQHKAFSTRENFLPLKPQGVHAVTDKSVLAGFIKTGNIALEELYSLGGLASVYKECIGSNVTKESLIKNTDQRNKSQIFGEILPRLIELDSKAVVEAEAQAEHEVQVGYSRVLTDESKELVTKLPEGGAKRESDEQEEVQSDFDRFQPSAENLKMYQQYVTSLGTASTGYCLMLDYSKITDEFLESCPQVFNYIEQPHVMAKLNIVTGELDEGCIPQPKSSLNPHPKQRRAKETIFSKIHTKVQACKKVVEDIASRHYKILSDTVLDETGEMVPRPYSYKEKALLEKEQRFFIQNSTAAGVLKTLNHYVEEERKTKWLLFPTVNFSEMQIAAKKRMADLQKTNKEVEDMIKYQLGAKYSNPYYDEKSNEGGNVLAHAQPKNAAPTQSKNPSFVCEVVGCKARTSRKCLTKACSRYLCTTHFVPGGHKGHENLEFKLPKPISNEAVARNTSNTTPAVPATDNNVAVQASVDTNASIGSFPALDSEQKGTSVSIVDNNVNVAIPATLCQVVECNDVAKHRCSELDCRFTAVCEMHYMHQHNSHYCMFHVDDESNRISNKRSKVSNA